MHRVAISIDVPDLDVATAFYCGALGCEKIGGQAANTQLSAGNVVIYLLRKEAGTQPVASIPDTRSYGRHWTPVHLDFHVVDLEQAVAGVIKLGGTHEGGQSGDWGGIACCADPYGNGFCLIKDGG